ncbi:MAG TPA: NAD(P)-binding domain-containing protein, partial [Thermoplasmata archaeon]|nr:NAD(P)-binding domain-containing protein [Thermoplasmata archaeon]
MSRRRFLTLRRSNRPTRKAIAAAPIAGGVYPVCKPGYVKWRGRVGDPMKIGILGSAGVGQSLASGFASNGHDVVIGSRTPGKKELRDFVA